MDKNNKLQELYISIVDDTGRTSTLVCSPTKGTVRIMGNLPHGAEFSFDSAMGAKYFASFIMEYMQIQQAGKL